jgi:hypothetical protein
LRQSLDVFVLENLPGSTLQGAVNHSQSELAQLVSLIGEQADSQRKKRLSFYF